MTRMVQTDITMDIPETTAVAMDLTVVSMAMPTTVPSSVVVVPASSVTTSTFGPGPAITTCTALPSSEDPSSDMCNPERVRATLPSVLATTLVAEYIDMNLAQAAITAVATGTLTPIIKEELRCTIQNKRLMSGMDELEVEYREEHHCQLTPAEEERRCKRRERNKVAAQKCRMKRKDVGDKLDRESHVLENKNEELRDEVNRLEREKQELERMLRSHDLHPRRDCNIRLSASECDDENDVIHSITCTEAL